MDIPKAAAERPAIQFHMTPADGEDYVRTFEGQPVVIGRGRKADVRISGGPISRRHLVFECDRGAWTVRNEGRLVETRRNGFVFAFGARAPVRVGDVFEVCGRRIEPQFLDRDGLVAWAEDELRRGSTPLLLRVDRDERASEWIGFERGPVVVGRSILSDIVVEGDEVSRRHAVFSPDDGAWTIGHRGRLLPTTVNGRRITSPERLADGDAVAVGSARLVVCTSGRVPRGSSPADASSPPTQTMAVKEEAPEESSDELDSFGGERTKEAPRGKPPTTDPLWSGAGEAAPASEELFPTTTDSRRDADATRTIDSEEPSASGPDAPAPSLPGSSPTLTEARATSLPPSTSASRDPVGSSRVDLQACKLEYSIVSPK